MNERSHCPQRTSVCFPCLKNGVVSNEPHSGHAAGFKSATVAKTSSPNPIGALLTILRPFPAETLAGHTINRQKKSLLTAGMRLEVRSSDGWLGQSQSRIYSIHWAPSSIILDNAASFGP